MIGKISLFIKYFLQKDRSITAWYHHALSAFSFGVIHKQKNNSHRKSAEHFPRAFSTVRYINVREKRKQWVKWRRLWWDFPTRVKLAYPGVNYEKYINDLNLVMVAPDGTFAAHAALNYDTANRYAIFEPVCTHPEHRQKGLAKALMQELLIPIRPMGAKIIEVSTGDADAANALYDSIGFTEYYKAYAWKKAW